MEEHFLARTSLVQAKAAEKPSYGKQLEIGSPKPDITVYCSKSGLSATFNRKTMDARKIYELIGWSNSYCCE